jgi:hypothetical protein
MARGEPNPNPSEDRRRANIYRFTITLGSAVGLVLLAVCFLAAQGGTDVGSVEANVEAKMQQLHQLASKTKLRSNAFLLLQCKTWLGFCVQAGSISRRVTF